MSDRQVRHRSWEWFGRRDVEGFVNRAWLKAEGFTDAVFQGQPVIGICNTWSELVNCNAHLRQVAEAVKRGVWQAGGFPLEFPAMSLGEALMRPTTMLYRNLLAMEVEENLRGYPIDGVVLLTGCDKTVIGALMGAASADLPALMVTGGPMLKGHWRNQELGSCTDCWRLYDELRAGRLTEEEWRELEGCVARSAGTCMVMGTAATLASLVEALGMTLPGGAAIPAVDSRRYQLAEEAGRRIVRMVETDLRPSQILTPEAFENAIRVLHATGGSTNAVIHLIALAGRVGVPLDLALFDELSRTTPLLANLKPGGQYVMEDFFYAGGIPALMHELEPLLHLQALTVTGRTVGENIARAQVVNHKVIAPREAPLSKEGGLVVLSGNLCPRGAILKQSAASPHLLQHEGLAVVFSSYEELQRRIGDPDLDIGEHSVMVLQNAGPKGGPGMPEWGHLPIPEKLLRRGIGDLVRISDARMSGTGYGTVVVHIAPEAAVGGPLAAVSTGDPIRLDVANRRLDLLLDDREIRRRLESWRPPDNGCERGYGWMYVRHVLQADEGCDFDFLRGASPVSAAPPRREVMD